MKKLYIFALLLFCWGCAAKAPVTPEPENEAEGVLERYDAFSEKAAAQDWRTTFSLRFGREGDTRRITGILWGSGDALRLDAMAGVGVTIAKILDEGNRFLVYLPQENKAYEHPGPNRPLLKLGAPLPFTLPDLAALMDGNYSEVFGKTPEFTGFKDGNYQFAVDEPGKGVLELDRDGIPAAWMDDVWTLKAAREEGTPFLRSLRLANKNGQTAVIIIKEREDAANGFSEKQMELPLPENTAILPLSEYLRK